MVRWILVRVWVQLRDIFLFLFRNAIIINAYVDDNTWNGIKHRNWGDDLNYYLIRIIAKRPVVIFQNFKIAHILKMKNYMCIGTILDATGYSNHKTIVWGSGVVRVGRYIERPQQLCSVRGRLTLNYIHSLNFDCPNIIGDPALLLPKYYTPKFLDKKYKLGLIPHITDLDNQVVQRIREYHKDILIIDLAHYKKWTDVIDNICSCEIIASSSLHGLIASDAYGIPNCWIKLGDNVCGGLSFKYLDYFSSVGRKEKKPWIVSDLDDLLMVKKCLKEWKKPFVDVDSILKSCPFITK